MMQSTSEILPLIAAVFAASVLGSMHCAGMCGAFLAFAVQPGSKGSEGGRRDALWPLHSAYHVGRLLTYTLLGFAAGGLGAAIDLGGRAAGVQRAALIGAGGLMVFFGVVAILRQVGMRLPRAPLPRAWRELIGKGQRLAFEMPPLARAWSIGLLTPMLPCGWLYAFAVLAAGTGEPVAGGLVMAVFWVGTLPVLIGLGVGVQAMTGVLRRHMPLLTSLAVVAVGLWTLLGRAPLVGVAQASESRAVTAGGGSAVLWSQPGATCHGR
ncbi:MAG: sulfite exporter TauE/SafE family protein [Planctomycetota bacterium]